MDNKLILIAKDYLIKVEQAKNIMIKGLRLRNFKGLLKLREYMPQGVFYYRHMENHFMFHGVGCQFFNKYLSNRLSAQKEQEIIDIDMELSGINLWMLYKFVLRYYPELKDEFTVNRIKEEFLIGIKEKIVVQKEAVYYFHYKYRNKISVLASDPAKKMRR